LSIASEDQPDLCNINKFYQNGKGNFWVALINKKVVGTISLLDIGYGQTALRKMFVEEEYRGKVYKIASTLLNELLNWAESKDVKEIYLGTTPKFLAAHRFYEITKKFLPDAFPVMKVDTKFYKFEL
jgi:N-acetylglutamate synthase-like GNAT family acetyltransferase